MMAFGPKFRKAMIATGFAHKLVLHRDTIVRSVPLTSEENDTLAAILANYIPANDEEGSVKRWDSAREFKQEFTQEERFAIRDLAMEDKYAYDFLDLLNGANYVVADDPDIVDGFNYFVFHGLLTQERMDEILGT